MKPVTEYSDYRNCIRDYYEECKRNSSFTWREFASRAGFSSAVYLKYVSEGKKNLSARSAERVAEAMQLAGYEKKFFVDLVACSLVKGVISRKKVHEKLRASIVTRRVRKLGENEREYFKSWKYPVVRELAVLMPKADAAELSKICNPEITEAEVAAAIDLLLKLKLLYRDQKGKLLMSNKSVTLGPVDDVSFAAREMQLQMGQLALNAIKSLPQPERCMMGLTFGTTMSAYGRVVKELEECRRRIETIVTEDDATEKVFRLNFQLFPLSNLIPDKEKCTES